MFPCRKIRGLDHYIKKITDLLSKCWPYLSELMQKIEKNANKYFPFPTHASNKFFFYFN